MGLAKGILQGLDGYECTLWQGASSAEPEGGLSRRDFFRFAGSAAGRMAKVLRHSRVLVCSE